MFYFDKVRSFYGESSESEMHSSTPFAFLFARTFSHVSRELIPWEAVTVEIACGGDPSVTYIAVATDSG